MLAKNTVCKWQERNVRLFPKTVIPSGITKQLKLRQSLNTTVTLQPLQTMETAGTDNQSQFSIILSRLRNVVVLFLATNSKGKIQEMALFEAIIEEKS